MLVARKALPMITSLAGRNGFQMRTSVISGPPTVKLSAAEKVIYLSAISVGVCFVPAWILTHLKDYRGEA